MRVKDARTEARDEERARDAEGEEDNSVADGWRTVLRLGQDVLRASKDFEVAAWMTEAMVRQHGLDGLITGCRLLTGMLERYWDEGFPELDEYGLEDRAITLGGLSGASADGTIMQPLRRLTVFIRSDNTPLPLYRYDQAEEVAGRPDAEYRQRRYEAGVPDLEIVQAEARGARPQIRGFGAKAAEALGAWRAFDAALTPRFSEHGEVPTSRVAHLLQRMVEVATTLAGAPAEAPAASEAGAAGQAGVPGAPMAGVAGGFVVGDTSGAIASREAALETLERIADFFERTEPHSFLAFTLRDAARRGRMTLPELLAEVLTDQSSRDGMLTALGIRPPQESGY
ncbi:type VI secretion system protein TssA [Roseomonas sp. CCTCC AB2023176]|uniref:type VI secretion system protein TssA n=1 Tax=Roseomonas sp. CCTCC AB2023176 TaxID=3342640 RepID=UPI0035D53FAB